jgi:hypothetical protein
MSKKLNGSLENSLVKEIKSIGWMGTPKSGKSKQIERVSGMLRDEWGLEARIFNNVEWKRKYAKGAKGVRQYFHAGYLIPLIHSAAEKTLDYKDPSKSKPNYLMTERNAQDFEAFTWTLYEQGIIDESELIDYLGNAHLMNRLPSEEKERYSWLFNKGLVANFSTDDLVICMKVSPEESMIREAKDAGAPRRGNVMTIPFLTALNVQYDALLERVKNDHKIDIVEIDGAAPLEENTEKIYNHVSQVFLPAHYTEQEPSYQESA